MVYFEKVKRFENEDIPLPERKTAHSAGYDFAVAEDIIIPPYALLASMLQERMFQDAMSGISVVNNSFLLNENQANAQMQDPLIDIKPVTLKQLESITKEMNARPTLVPTGVKVKLESDEFLMLSIRSSSPLKQWLILGNAIGVIDADYYGNESNDGEIFFQIINLSPYEIQLHKGDIIGQGTIMKYETVSNDNARGTRTGGFGSTTK